MKLILVPEITPRVEYTAEVIFRTFSHTDFRLTENRDEFIENQEDKINYTPEYLEGIPWIKPQGLLSGHGIQAIEVKVSEYQGIPVIFPSEDERTILPFDVFSAVFYFLSRYEEYLPFEADVYGRFTAAASLAGKNNFPDIPVVDHWVDMLTGCVKDRNFTFISTVDIDVAWAYRHKGLVRNAGGFISDLYKGRFSELRERLAVLTGRQEDPYDTYGFIEDFHRQQGIRPVFFLLLGDYAKNDKNVPHTNPYLHELVRKLDTFGDTGIHPSFDSFLQEQKVGREISRLSAITGRPVEKSRQHFLMMSLPRTYEILINQGIREDYSMGFSDQPGFRAGCCTPFPYYDLSQEKKTDLMVFPFTVMEGTLKDYLGYSPEKAVAAFEHLISKVKAVNGTFISIWHNESLSDKKRWKGWREVFTQSVQAAEHKGIRP